MANFIDEPTRGDGTSWKLTKHNFNKPPHFRDPTLDELRSHLKESDKDEWTRRSFIDKSNEIVRAPAKIELLLRRPGKGLFAQKYKNGAQLCWMSGFWCGSLELDDTEGLEETYPRWSLSVLVGDFYKTGARQVRQAIINSHGEKVYGQWKRAVLEDKKGCTEVLDAIAHTCGKRKKIAIGYTTSDSSKRLLKKLGIRVDEDWTFLYPHYKGNWKPNKNPYIDANKPSD
jgi:hypothetical protein